MNGPEHYREAERLMKQGDEWMDADTGWKARLGVDERLARRTADLLAAQVHATLADAAATAVKATVAGTELGVGEEEFQAWYEAAGVRPRKAARDDSDV